MDDQEFSDLINADHEELSDDDHNTWLILSAEIKSVRKEISENRTRLKQKDNQYRKDRRRRIRRW